jgi:hypothetical protein
VSRLSGSFVRFDGRSRLVGGLCSNRASKADAAAQRAKKETWKKGATKRRIWNWNWLLERLLCPLNRVLESRRPWRYRFWCRNNDGMCRDAISWATSDWTKTCPTTETTWTNGGVAVAQLWVEMKPSRRAVFEERLPFGSDR